MEGRVITKEMLESIGEHLRKEEKSRATIEKYLRDIRAFAAYADGREITKETDKSRVQEARKYG